MSEVQIARFVNEKARRLADAIMTVDRTLDQFLLDVVRDVESVKGSIGDKEPVKDKADEDGRNVVTVENIAQLKFVCEQLKACLDQDDRRAIVHRFSVNGQPVF